MTTFASQITSPMATAATDAAGALTNAQTVATNMNATNFGSITLGNLATSTTSWRSDVGDLRIRLANAINDLALANREIVDINNLLIAIGGLD